MPFQVHRKTNTGPSSSAASEQHNDDHTRIQSLRQLPKARYASKSCLTAIPMRRGRRVVYSHIEVYKMVESIATELRESGVRPQTSCAFLLPNAMDAIVYSLAIQWIGAIAVPLDPAMSTERLAATLALVASATVVSPLLDEEDMEDDILYQRVAQTCQRLDLVHWLVGRSTNRGVHIAMRGVRAGEGAAWSGGSGDYKLDSAEISFRLPSATHPQSAFIEMSHRQFAETARLFAETYTLTEQSSMLLCVPFHDVHGLLATFATMLAGGNVIIPEGDDIDKADVVLSAMEKHPVSWLTVTPTLLFDIAETVRGGGGAALSSSNNPPSFIRVIDGAIDEAAHKSTQDALGVPVLPAYGTQSTCGMVAACRLGKTRLGSVGKTVGKLDVIVVVDEGGERVPVGEEGLIAARGEHITSAIEGGGTPRGGEAGMKDEEEKKSTQKYSIVEHEGVSYMVTGDRGRMDEDGFLHMTQVLSCEEAPPPPVVVPLVVEKQVEELEDEEQKQEQGEEEKEDENDNTTAHSETNGYDSQDESTEVGEEFEDAQEDLDEDIEKEEGLRERRLAEEAARSEEAARAQREAEEEAARVLAERAAQQREEESSAEQGEEGKDDNCSNSGSARLSAVGNESELENSEQATTASRQLSKADTRQFSSEMDDDAESTTTTTETTSMADTRTSAGLSALPSRSLAHETTTSMGSVSSSSSSSSGGQNAEILRMIMERLEAIETNQRQLKEEMEARHEAEREHMVEMLSKLEETSETQAAEREADREALAKTAEAAAKAAATPRAGDVEKKRREDEVWRKQVEASMVPPQVLDDLAKAVKTALSSAEKSREDSEKSAEAAHAAASAAKDAAAAAAEMEKRRAREEREIAADKEAVRKRVVVSLEEVEDAVRMHPAVDAARAFGRPDARFGNEVFCAVRLKNGARVSEPWLKLHAQSMLPAPAVPKKFFAKNDLCEDEDRGSLAGSDRLLRISEVSGYAGTKTVKSPAWRPRIV